MLYSRKRFPVVIIAVLLIVFAFMGILYYAQKKESERIREIVKVQREERAQKEESNAADDLGETDVAVDTASVYDTSGELLGDFIKKEDREKSGITYSWNDSGCYISGTAIAPSTYNVFSSKNSLPKVFVPGKTYYMISNIHMPYTWVRMVWYKSNGETEQDKFGFSNGAGEFTVPADAVGLVVRFSVDSGSSVDGQVGLPEVYLCEERKLKVPLLVTFIDDDTSNDEYIHRYYENCKHNGITGNYAVITSHIEEGKTSLQNLLNYESDGFGMLVHCYAQNSSWREEDIAACSENLEKALTQMDEYGFHNYNYWITPGGHHTDWHRELAELFRFRAMISTANRDHNSVFDYDQYFIKRVSLNPTNEVETKSIEAVKEAIDNAKEAGYAWIIITTHFNEWDDLPWDDTKDGNGYSVGYERFNEVVQYALSLGFENMSFQDAWEIYEPILEANQELYGHVQE